MKKQLLLFSLFAIFITNNYAQKLTVSDTILNELHTKIFVGANNDTVTLKVVYPENYDSEKSYPILLALSGGNQSDGVVNYCYAAWFKSNYFKNYITILPVNTKRKNFRTYKTDDIKNIFTIIKNNFKTNKDSWIIAGTSNGGIATFNFLAVEPALFQGAIVMPGAIDSERTKIEESWKHLKVVLAYGEKDDTTWITATEESRKALQDSVKSVQSFVMKGQGHILTLDYDIDQVYDVYFKK